ncbi:MAG: hypothetical protein RJA76_666 [Bacteroidota bacterium]|jgi:cell division protein FtsA
MRNEFVIGVDLGSSFVRAALGKQNTEGNIEILSIAKVPTLGHVSNGEIININKTAQAVTDVLKSTTSGITGKLQDLSYVSNITGAHIKVHPFTIQHVRENPRNPVSEKEIYDITQKAKKSIYENNHCVLHTLTLGFKVDQSKETLDPIGMVGTILYGDFLFVTADEEKLDTLKQTIKSSELASIAEGITFFSQLATGIAVLSEEEKNAGVAIVDLGSGTTEISVYQNNRLRHSKVLPWGGDLITEDIATGLNISIEHAEALKTKYGSSLSKEIDVKEIVLIPGIAGRKPTPISAKNLAIIIEERVRELSAAIWVEIGKIAEPESLKAGLVLVGGGAQLPDIAESIQKITGIETRIGEPNERAISIALEEEVNSPEYASAVGLVKIFFQQIEIPNELEMEEVSNSESGPTTPSSSNEPSKPKEPKVNFKKFLDRVVEVVMGNDEDVSKEW